MDKNADSLGDQTLEVQKIEKRFWSLQSLAHRTERVANAVPVVWMPASIEECANASRPLVLSLAKSCGGNMKTPQSHLLLVSAAECRAVLSAAVEAILSATNDTDKPNAVPALPSTLALLCESMLSSNQPAEAGTILQFSCDGLKRRFTCDIITPGTKVAQVNTDQYGNIYYFGDHIVELASGASGSPTPIREIQAGNGLTHLLRRRHGCQSDWPRSCSAKTTARSTSGVRPRQVQSRRIATSWEHQRLAGVLLLLSSRTRWPWMPPTISLSAQQVVPGTPQVEVFQSNSHWQCCSIALSGFKRARRQRCRG